MASERELEQALDMLTGPHIESLRTIRRIHAGRGSRARAAADAMFGRLRTALDSDNVVGIGIASKRTGGADTDELALAVYVAKKRPLSRLRGDAVVPPAIPESFTSNSALPTDVVELGEVFPEVNAVRRPIQPGFSIGHFRATCGTLGAIVHRGRQPLVLSNSHVLAESGKARVGDAVLFPGKMDGGRRPVDVIATLAQFIPFVVGGDFVNEVDCAVASLTDGRARDLDPAILKLGIPSRTTLPRRGMQVVKVGRTTGLTEGTVRDIHFRVRIPYPDVGPVGFRDQVLCTRYSEPGDSGSLVLEKATRHAVGLHFGGSDGTDAGSFFNPIRAVLSALKVTLATGPARGRRARARGRPGRSNGRGQ